MLIERKEQIYRVGKLVFLAIILLGSLVAVTVPQRNTAADTSAQNVIIFIGDGMGTEHVRGGGLFANGAAGTLSFESFPSATTSTHNNVSNGTTDSAAGATAIATGFKVPNGVISQAQNGSPLTTLLELHKAEGKRTGLVTTSYMTDASVAAFGAHNESRGNRTQIANDYFNDSRPNVLFGGGGNGFTTSAASSAGYGTVTTRNQLLNINTEGQTLIAGVFGSGEIPPEGMAGRSSALPTLPEMTESALNILDNGSDGLFLVVEHEGSDTYSHANNGEGAIRSVAELSAAVQKAIDWKANNPNTIILVTADHETGGMTVNGNSGAGTIPSTSWSTGGHTQDPIPVYADGVSADQINRQQIDNTDIFDMLRPAALSGGNSGVVDISIVNGNDDVEERTTDGDMYFDSSDLELTEDQDYRGSNQVIGLRFTGVDVPQGATITSAYLQFVADETQSESTSLTIYGHDADNALPFSSANYNASQRPKTSVNTEWENIPGWTEGSTVQSPSLIGVVQKIVDRSGWSDGNSMAFVITGGGRRVAESANKTGGTSPLLHVEYTISNPTGGTVDVRVSESNDDVEQLSDGSIYFDSSDLEFFNDPNRAGNTHVGIRFQNVDVPQGATVTNAYLEFVVDELDNGATNVTIRAHDANSAGEFTAATNNVSARPKTSAGVAWNNIPAWTSIGSTQQSPDIKNVVQEVVDRSGWNSGSSMAFVMEGSGRRTAGSYDGSSSQAPLLHIEYTIISGPTPIPPTPTDTPTPIPPTPTDTPTPDPGGDPTDVAYPWQAAAGAPTSTDRAWNYALGYVFTPKVNGYVTHLGGYFNGTKTVKLFDATSNQLLTQGSVTAANDWGYTDITDLAVTAGTTYRLVVYMAGSGGSYQGGVSYPFDSENITFLNATYVSTSGNPDAVPTSANDRPQNYTYVLGQPDIGFSASGGAIPTDTPTPTPIPTPNNSVPALNTYNATYAQNEDFGSGSIEFSAVTYNYSNGDIVIVEDGDNLFKYSTSTTAPMIPIESSKQAMGITVGSGDTEGVAWMYGTTYAILSEYNGQIHIVDLSDYGNGDDIDSADRTITTGISGTDNKGLEGIAFKFGSATSAADEEDAIFYAVEEKSGTILYEINWNGVINDQITISGLVDLSDVYYGAANGEMYIISDDSQKVVQLGAINWNASSISATGKPSISLTGYEQAEGVAFNADQSMMVVVAEDDPDIPGAGLTYGRFTAP